MAEPIHLARPCFDEREVEAVRRVLASGWVVQGPEVEAFEAEIAKLQQARYCVAVSSGTAALHVAYLSLGIGPGDAVFIPSFAWPSAANMAMLVGARPVFTDVLPGTYNIDCNDLARRIEDCLQGGQGKPRAIVPVHEFGLAAEMDQVQAIAKRYSLDIIEDAACALGAHYQSRPVGTFGRLGIFSFHPRKSITTGEGGAIVTNDGELAERCRLWRNHGQQLGKGPRAFVVPGLNYRLTEIQAAIGRTQLAKLPKILEQRSSLVSAYFKSLAGVDDLTLPVNAAEHTWQTFMPVLTEPARRTKLIEVLRQEKIEAGPGSVAGHLGAVFQPQPVLPVAQRLHEGGLALPLHPGLSTETVTRCASALTNRLKHGYGE